MANTGVANTAALSPQILSALVSQIRANSTGTGCGLIHAAQPVVSHSAVSAPKAAYSKDLVDTISMSEAKLLAILTRMTQGLVNTDPVLMFTGGIVSANEPSGSDADWVESILMEQLMLTIEY